MNLKLEIASRSFLGALLKLVSNAKTHSIVKGRILDLIASWADVFKGESRLDYCGEVYRQLVQEGILTCLMNRLPVSLYAASNAKENNGGR